MYLVQTPTCIQILGETTCVLHMQPPVCTQTVGETACISCVQTPTSLMTTSLSCVQTPTSLVPTYLLCVQTLPTCLQTLGDKEAAGSGAAGEGAHVVLQSFWWSEAQAERRACLDRIPHAVHP